MGKFEPPEDEEELQAWIKRQKAKGVRAFKGRYGWVTSAAPLPKNPRTDDQQRHRQNHRAVVGRWGSLADEQQAAWRVRAANKWFTNDEGRQVRLNCYNLFTSLNVRRADLGLPQFDLPPVEPRFLKNCVDELAATLAGGALTLELHVPGPMAEHTLVYGAAPVRSGVRLVQHFHFLGLLPPPKDGWSNIAQLYVARYGVPKPGMAIWVRVCQHIDGYVDTPKVFRFRLPPAAT